MKESRKFSKRFTSTAIAAVALIVISGCGSGGTEAGDLRAAYMPAAPSLPDQLALEVGYFEDRGVNVLDDIFDSGPAMQAAALAGEVDILQTSPAQLVSANAEGGCMKFISTGARNIFRVLGHPDDGWSDTRANFPESIQGIEGMTIGVPARGSGGEFAAREMLRQANIDPEEVTYVATGGGASGAAAFEAGQVDVWLGISPAMEALDSDSYVELVNMLEVPELSNYMSGAMAVTCDAWENKQQAVLDYCRAQWDAVSDIQGGEFTDEIRSAIVNQMHVGEAEAAAFFDNNREAIEDPILTPDIWAAQEHFIPDGLELPRYDDVIISECATGDPR